MLKKFKIGAHGMPHINNVTQTNNSPHRYPIHSRVDLTHAGKMRTRTGSP